jgi:tetratricopeptide (TPR) repeat protein
MAETGFKYDVFISYSHKDEEWVVDTLLSALENAGLKACIDFRDFVPGKPSRHNMRDACKESKYTVLVMTPAWMASEWTSFEGLLTFLHDPANKHLRTVPILFEKCDIPEDIQIFTYVDFLRKDREAIAWKQLFTSLGKPDAAIPGTPVKEPEPKTPESWFLKHPYGMPPNFTGRRTERNMLTGWLNSDKDHSLLIVRALGGFGKSALTWHWLTHDVDAKQYPAVVFWSFYEGDASFENFLKETLKYLGVINAEQLNPRQQTEILLNLLQRPGLLLILDGFERVLRAYSNMGAAYQGDELQIDRDDSQDKGRDCVNIFADAFLQGIGAFGYMMRSKVLMTTRLTPRVVERHGQFLQGVREEELREMKKEDAVAFFHAQGIRGTHAEIEAACEPYGYHPLSLRILAGMIVNNRNAPGDISAAKNLEITGDIIQNKHHVLETAFNSLSVPQKSLLGQIACFRAAMTYDALKTLHRDGKGNIILDEMLKILESRGLVHWDRKANKYDLHPIVRRFAYDRLTASDRNAAHTRLVNYFDAVPKLEKVEKLEDLAPVIELYHHMVGAGNLDEARKIFKDRLDTPTYYQFGAYQLQIELLRALFPDGEDKPPRLKTESVQAQIINDLANSYSLSGQPRRAVPLFEMHSALREKAGDKKNLAIGLGNVGGMAQLPIGALSDTEHNLHRSIDLCREIADEFWEAVGHQELGRVLSYRGAWQEAGQELDSAIAIQQKIKHVQTEGLSNAYHALRFLLLVRANQSSTLAPHASADVVNLKSSIESAQRALELADEWKKITGRVNPNPRDYTRGLWLLGSAYRANNELTLAEENLSKALNLCRQINLVENEADILLDLARLSFAYGLSSSAQDRLQHFKDAQEKASEALVITERSGFVLQGADVNLFLAELAVAGYRLESLKVGSDKEAAIHHAKEALKLAMCDGPPYYYKVAYEEAEKLLASLS